ncbi:hypothetical protein GCM10028784_38790 [Myceligenerans cantabricum]
MATLPATAGPTAELQSVSVHQNRTISIVGSGFTPGGEVTWDLHDPDGNAVSSQTARTDDDGKVYRQVTPTTNMVTGSYALKITDGATGASANVALQILPAADAPPLSASLRTEPNADGTTTIHVSGLPRNQAAEFALAREGVSGLSRITPFDVADDGTASLSIDSRDLGEGTWVALLDAGRGWFTDGTTLAPPPSGPYVYFQNGNAELHQDRITGISAYNLGDHRRVTWKVYGPDGTEEGSWKGTPSDGTDAQWLAATSSMEPGTHTVEVLAQNVLGTNTIASATFDVLPAADAPSHQYDVQVSSDEIEAGDPLPVAVTGGGVEAGLIPVNAITDSSVSTDLGEPDQIGRRTAVLRTDALPPEFERFYVAVHDGDSWHLTGTEISVGASGLRAAPRAPTASDLSGQP